MVVVAVIRGVAAEDMNAARRADPTIPLSKGESKLVIRTGSACSDWMLGKRILADIPRIVMEKTRGTRIKAAHTTEPLARSNSSQTLKKFTNPIVCFGFMANYDQFTIKNLISG
jgi:hypothetical protein